MHVAPWAVLAIVLAAGCAGPESPPPPLGTSTHAAPPAPGICTDAFYRPVPSNGTCPRPAPLPDTVEDVHLDGHTGTILWACELDVPDGCVGQELSASDNEVRFQGVGTPFRGANLTVTWTAGSAVTETLHLAVMVMGQNRTIVAEAVGPSPLRVQVARNDTLQPDTIVHAFVYNEKGVVRQPPVVGGASPDQPFVMEGTMTFGPPVFEV